MLISKTGIGLTQNDPVSNWELVQLFDFLISVYTSVIIFLEMHLLMGSFLFPISSCIYVIAKWDKDQYQFYSYFSFL